ncbi:septum formation initiator family protein [candidate division WOR-3 bacterium]|nr:septum formation initiator family protein [candidate division WOR-3 bacterium]
MRIILIFTAIVVYLFLLVYTESELVKIEVRMENLQNRMRELDNKKKDLESEIMDISNLALIEAQAKERGFVFPEEADVHGALK